MSVIVSVIMPVYNSEKHLRQTLDSVLAQTFHDFELIAVNDGSNDGSLSILHEYQSRITNMHVINQANTGVSVARNNALKKAAGEFVCFLDADDILHPDFIKILYQTVENMQADISFCEYQVFYGEKCQFNKSDHPQTLSVKKTHGKKTFDYMMELGLGTSSCNKMYRVELLLRNDILFDTESSYGEDMFFNWKVSMVASDIIYTKQALYGYRLSVGTATTKYHSDLLEKYCHEFDMLLAFGELHGQDISALKESVELNLAQRIPSFLRMNLRRRASIYQKYQYVIQLADDERIKLALNTWSKTETDNSKKSVQAYLINRKYMVVFLKSICDEIHFKLARKLKNMK